jgi:mevalonate kinase
MPATSASAPGKIILFGEHAVVYGRPAIAVPVQQVQARAVVKAEPRAPAGAVRISAPDIGLEGFLEELPKSDPLAAAVRLVLKELGLPRSPACSLRVTSTIPVASGLGSGAAVTVAILRAFSAFLGRPLGVARVSDLAFEIEKLHHGTPSGIDNTTIAYGLPVFFVKGQPILTFTTPTGFRLLIADTGIASPTAASVADVRQGWQKERPHYEAMFDSIGAITESAYQMISSGMVETLGPLMDANHGILRRIGVSSPELERLVEAAREAGASGAKLSGGGRGGNMIALVGSKSAERVAGALLQAGATRVITTEVK